jgi:hypothetical protein
MGNPRRKTKSTKKAIMKIEKLEDKIFYYTDLLIDPVSFLNNIESVTNSSVISKWKPWVSSNSDLKHGEYKEIDTNFLKNLTDNNSIEMINIITDSVSKCIENYIKETNSESGYLPNIINIRKYDTEAYMGPHIDTEDGEDRAKPYISLVFYLNDNYNGGEINFPNQDVSLKPKAGSIIIFPSIDPYYHDPRPVSNGIKYMIPLFFHRN